MTSLQTTQAYQVSYDYGKEGALVDALLGGDVPERRTPRKTNQAQVAALPDDDDDERAVGGDADGARGTRARERKRTRGAVGERE